MRFWQNDSTLYLHFIYTHIRIHIHIISEWFCKIHSGWKKTINKGRAEASMSVLTEKGSVYCSVKNKKDIWYILSPAFWVIHEVRSKGFLIMNFTDITVQRLRTSSFSAYHWWNIVGWFIFSILHCSMCTNLVFPQIRGTLSLIYGQSQGKCIHHLFLFRDLVLFVFHGLFVISTVGVFCAVDSSDI